VEATQRRYLRDQWDTYLSGGVDRTTGYVDGPQGLALADDMPPTSSALTVPIKLRGEPIGVLEFFNEGHPNTWSQDEQDLVSALADQAALALENARLFEDTQSRAMRERMINEITARIRASMDMETILHTTAEELARTLNLSRARIRLTPGDTQDGQGS
jgi:GAF domain-containing protein